MDTLGPLIALPPALVIAIGWALYSAKVRSRLRQDVEFLHGAHAAMRGWFDEVAEVRRKAEADRRWGTYELQDALRLRRPPVDGQRARLCLRNPRVRKQLAGSLAALETDLQLWDCDWASSWATLNEQHVRRELGACKDLFDRVESKPLTEEQARAVICFDNRVQVVASAGSGKTSTMVAKAAYAIHRGFVAPERIVMLAFNKKAAEELKERAARSFERLGMQGLSVQASTFHALGLSIIGHATGQKPDVPDWATDPVLGFQKLSELVAQLKGGTDGFRARWDLFRFAFGRDLPGFGSAGRPDVWCADGSGRAVAVDGTRVRSQEEKLIADWLFFHGITYAYERPYEVPTADRSHRQYKPDFYYPDIGLYHEHFALDARGEAPAEFTGYLQGVEWKRQLHKAHGTELIETTSHQVRSGEAFELLGKALTDRGVTLDPNSDRPVPAHGQRPMEEADLTKLVRTFIGHAKSNGLTIEAMRRRLEAMPKGGFRYRYKLFLDITAPILQAWDAALASEGGIDFEDMLNLAAEHLEGGRYEAPYDLVMADEFQDASRARARLCRALVGKPGRHLFAVGDDWQSINRFAGADVSVMTGFREYFGHGQVLKLEQTFRCPQELCDVSSRFVAKNPAQLKKRVRSVTPAVGPVLRAFEVDDRDKLQSAVAQFLEELSQGLREGTVPPGRDGKVSVFVLGRFNAEEAYVPPGWKARHGRWLNLAFSSIHRSKGSEADYVVLPAMVERQRSRSFPDTRADDPVLALAMPSGDSYPLGEERRLFYVALTRARRSVAMFTVRGDHSSFLTELVEDGAVVVTNSRGEAVQEKRCPVCREGVIVTKTGRYGEFQGCSSYPSCEYKPNSQRPSRSGVRPPV